MAKSGKLPTNETREIVTTSTSTDRQLPTTPPASARPTLEEIAREAYILYLAMGAREGFADADWFEAERALQARITDQVDPNALDAGVADPPVPEIRIGMPHNTELGEEPAGV
jgi:hypothetical protein